MLDDQSALPKCVWGFLCVLVSFIVSLLIWNIHPTLLIARIKAISCFDTLFMMKGSSLGL